MTKWTFLDEGKYNRVYVNEEYTLVFKIPKPQDDPVREAYDAPPRAMRLWQELNPEFKDSVYLHSDPTLGEGWVQPFFKYKQANDKEIMAKVLEIYLETGRIVLDAICRNNIINLDGKIMCLDASMAVKLPKYQSANDKLGRRGSVISIQLWSLLQSAFIDFFSDKEYASQGSVQLIQALIFLDTSKTITPLSDEDLKALSSDAPHGKYLRLYLASQFRASMEQPENKMVTQFNFYQSKKRIAKHLNLQDLPQDPLPFDDVLSIIEGIKENNLPEIKEYPIKEVRHELFSAALKSDHKTMVQQLIRDKDFILQCSPDTLLSLLKKPWPEIVDQMLYTELPLNTVKSMLNLIIQDKRLYKHINRILKRYAHIDFSMWGDDILRAFMLSEMVDPSDWSTAQISHLFRIGVQNQKCINLVDKILRTLISQEQRDRALSLLNNYEYFMSLHFKDALFLKMLESGNIQCAQFILNKDKNLYKNTSGKSVYLQKSILQPALNVALETEEYEIAYALLVYKRQSFSQEQFLALGHKLIETGRLYLVIDLLIAHQRRSLLLLAPEPTTPDTLLTETQFDCIFKCFPSLFTLLQLIQYQLNLIKIHTPVDLQVKVILQKQVMACYHFLRSHKTDSGYGRHNLEDSLLFLKRILFRTIPSQAALEDELTHYIDGKESYTHWWPADLQMIDYAGSGRSLRSLLGIDQPAIGQRQHAGVTGLAAAQRIEHGAVQHQAGLGDGGDEADPFGHGRDGGAPEAQGFRGMSLPETIVGAAP